MAVLRSDFRGINDMYMDTSAYNLDPSFNYYLNDPRELDQRRLRAYKYFMDFYDGKQWPDMMSGTLSSSEWNPAFGMFYLWNEDFNRRTWNIAQIIVDKHVAFFSNGGFNISIPAELDTNKPDKGNNFKPQGDPNKPPSKPSQNSDNDGEEPAEPDDTGGTDDEDDLDPRSPEGVLTNVWDANSKEDFLQRVGYTLCITGDAFIRISYDPDFYADGVGELTIQVLDSRTCIPYFDPNDKTKMIACKIQYPMKQLIGNGQFENVMYQEIHTETSIVQVVDGQMQDVLPNPLGELMVIHIPNEPLPYRKFGRSDMESLILPCMEHNEKVSDLSEILAYHAAPITVIKGARVQNLERGARKVWGGIPKDGDVFNLELKSDLAATLEYIKQLRQHIFELGGVPEVSTSDEQEVSNTSAAALHVQYQPLIERNERKQISAGKGLQKVNRLILRFYEMAGVVDLPDDCPPAKKYLTTIEWGDALPHDRSIDLQDISTEIGLGIESRKGAMERLGVENPTKKLKEVEEDAKRQAQLDFETAGMGMDSGMGGQGGTMGTKAGAKDGPQSDVQGAINAAKQNPAAKGNQQAQQSVKNSAQQSITKKKY